MIPPKVLESAHDPLVGRSLGEFVVRGRIGAGGFGAVYRAMQPALEREAVIKVLHAELLGSTAATERFLREAKLASKLDHPYAAHVYAFGAEPDGELWIAMELVRGTPLDRLLKLQGALSLERFVPLLDRICEVVHTAHEQGIVHRDLKPANVMVLTRAGRLLPKLLDFGIAKGLTKPLEAAAEADTVVSAEAAADVDGPKLALSDTLATTAPGPTPSDELTQRGAVMGSPVYMAPEQWTDAGQVDGRTDLYALGILAYECLTGKPPFAATTITQIAMAHARHAPPPLGPGFPLELDGVFAKVLAKRADERYPDALVFAAAFRQAAGIAHEAVHVPALDAAVRDAVVANAPQPIAEAVSALAVARNAHQARDAVSMVVRAVARYLGSLALACRSRVAGDASRRAADAIRTLSRRSLSDAEWLELARVLTGGWLDHRDAYPIPELIDACHAGAALAALVELTSLHERKAPTAAALDAVLEAAVSRLSSALAELSFLYDYSLVVVVEAGLAERWMGVQRTSRAKSSIRGRVLATGTVALLDSDGAPVLSLSPLFQAAPPAPGAVTDLFMFDGRDARGAKMVALPAGFERHDDALWDWFRAQLSASLDETEAKTVDDHPPYRGLRAFSVEDGASFVGREALVDAVVNRLKTQPLIAVVGPSGAGKSSFVQAGVLPALPGWRAITMRPGASPLGALAARLEHAGAPAITREALARDRDALGDLLREDAARRGPLVLVVDQLEEMFTLCHEEAERTAFAHAIAAAARAEVDPVRVIFTLRDDFLMRTDQVPALRNRVGLGLQLLSVPAAEDLLRILVEPARRAGFEYEDPDLPRMMVDEVADRPGALALLSFTASKLWEQRDRHFKQLTRAAYKALGGVGGALARHADITLDAMPPAELALAREAFRHLVTSQSTRAVRTRADLHELLGGAEQADRVIEQLIAARLLVASENESGAETIEIVHEALLVAWPRLIEWCREDADSLRFREQLRTAAAQWHERGRPRGLLWRGEALVDFARWRARDPGALTELERSFTDASRSDAERGLRNRRLLVAGAFAALVAVVVGLIAFNTRIAGQRREARENLQRQVEEQGRRLVLAGEPLQALAYLASAADQGAHGFAHDFLVAQAVMASDGELLELHNDAFVQSPRFSTDGTRFITAGFDHEGRISDARTGALVLQLHHPGPVTTASFAPDDATALTASLHDATLWNARTGQSLRTFHHDGDIECARYSGDGRHVLTAADDDSVALWNLADGARLLRVQGDGAGMVDCALAPNGETMVAVDSTGATWVWNAHTGARLHVLRDPRARARAVRISPDGSRLVTSAYDSAAAEWDVASGDELRVLAHKGAAYTAEFSPDGTRIVTASDDRTVAVWDARTGEQQRVLPHPASVRFAAFSPDDRYIVTGSDDASVRLWDVASGQLVARLRGHEDVVEDGAFSADSGRIVTVADDGSAIVWRAAPQQHVTWIAAGSSQQAASFSPDATRVVTADLTGSAHIWDAETGRELQSFHAYDGHLSSIAYSPDGRWIAIESKDGSVGLWDAATGEPGAPLAHGATLNHRPGPSSGNELGWSHDGASLVAGSDDGRIRCWDVSTHELRFERTLESGVISAAFAPNHDFIVTVSNGAIQRWTLDGTRVATYPDTFAMIAKPDASGARILVGQRKQRAQIIQPGSAAPPIELVGHTGWINATAWNPDGTLIVTGSLDSTARLWDASTGDSLAILEHPSPVHFVAFSPDGASVVVVGIDDKVAIHRLPHADPALGLAETLRCRVPYEVRGTRLVSRRKDEQGCTGSY